MSASIVDFQADGKPLEFMEQDGPLTRSAPRLHSSRMLRGERLRNFQSTRRLMLSGAADGRPYPFYYAHAAASEFRPEEDLDLIVQAGLFEKIADPTPHAAALVAALRNTRTAAGQQPWLMTINNVGAAQRHQLHRMCLSANDILSLSSENTYAAVERWLSTAMNLQPTLLEKIDAQKTRYCAPVGALLRALRSA